MGLRLIHVTGHALDQALERFAQIDREQMRQRIAHEVDAALRDGRYSSRCPSFASFANGRRPVGRRNGGRERDRTLRYAWDEQQQHIYLVDRRGNTINVVTSIAASDDTRSETA